ncbi:bifunctional glutamine-synthetase adenylyltransferase/deadenyltransferase [Canicola haemoglobinophilus]|uniref:Bifunctional glutamine synthetase adenylyltransferase/adenylyl-removing enzyme n=1 Tax=Canicola haemoglobinophilus TaxID=733 RepID=A0AB38H753_9PAST|nr:bifunctional [glutamate--ammonia ligase]-adenylyl-L-tyrosine phosphorylase/[glutamate--ammonia-ligase] adenylyltransferase [Canicola haemoglobinophilus]STO53509.1 bifunctional glutamine-synthetase adenylyltransferase/deadenyltransferase [Canicola haemoglobinophilus]STO68043.1 bifunctional glutamine-synthetase adenylyltransferase/deadenyltransferase [Canicola haemoglobinophilus]
MSLLLCAEERLMQCANCLIEHFPEQFVSTQNNTALFQQIQQDKDNQQSHIGKLGYGLGLSDFVFETMQKQPYFLLQCWENCPTFTDCDHYATNLQNILKEVETEEQLYRSLRQFRAREMAKLSLCQSLNLATVEEIFIRLSQLAESLIIAARDWLYDQTCKELGTPTDAQGNAQKLYILGMGKLGGFELNFSSDIDLIFTYPTNDGETQGGRRSIENSKFFTRLGQRLIRALDEYTADGFVYRTDMRLRPFGESGALALSFNAMEQYYQEQGRDWERYAMIKARILGADKRDANVQILQQLLRPFVYRRYIDFSVIQSLRDMKSKIAREIHRRGLIDNIKLGAGGIREIEFIVQVFQLIRGGREAILQQTSLLNLLPVLERLGLLNAEQKTNLHLAYLFLRRVENILQAINDKQTQTLPSTEKDRERLILATKNFTYFPIFTENEPKTTALIQYPIENWQQFLAVLHEHQQKVRSVFQSLIGEDTEEEEKNSTDDIWHDFLDADLSEQEIETLLQENQIDEQHFDEIIEKLIQFKLDLTRRSVGERGRHVLTQLVPMLFNQLFQYKNYLQLLPRMLKIVEKIVTRTTYLELLVENPQALTQLLKLCAKSKMIAEQVTKYPILLDELLDPNALLNPIDFHLYSSELHQYLRRLPSDDEEQIINGLRQFKQTTLLRVAAADILGALPVMKVSDHLTYLAESIIETVVNLAWQQVSLRFGIPEYLDKQQKGFLVIGYGKLGGIELGYKSDLDLVFLYDGNQTGQTIGGKKSIDSNQFYLKLAQKIISIFNMNTSAGILYNVDIRLRPAGDAGLLGCSLNAFENYQMNEAWTWEKQALVRSRVVYGDLALRERFDNIRQNVLSAPRDLLKLKQDIRDMREKMYQHLSKHQADKFNIKTDRGGITDIEFIAQYLVLAHAPANPTLTHWSDNVRIFDSMAESAVIPQETSEKLKKCYVNLRNQIHHLHLLGKDPIIETQKFHDERNFILDIWKNLLE